MMEVMKEREVLRFLMQKLPNIGDDCAIIPFKNTNLVLTTDMLWRRADFPAGVTAHAMGWRAAAASLSDIAAMGAKPLGVVLAVGAPEFERPFLEELLQGVLDCCQSVNAPYVGGDISRHEELTLVSSALGEAKRPVKRSGAKPGELVCVTGQLGRTAAALRLFKMGDLKRANRLFEFTPRVKEGLALAPYATSMMDISDGLARSLYQLGEASHIGFKVRWRDLPLVPELEGLAQGKQEQQEMALYTGEDFELIFTLPPGSLSAARKVASFTVIGEVAPEGFWIEEDGALMELEDRGYEH